MAGEARTREGGVSIDRFVYRDGVKFIAEFIDRTRLDYKQAMEKINPTVSSRYYYDENIWGADEEILSSVVDYVLNLEKFHTREKLTIDFPRCAFKGKNVYISVASV